MPKKRFPDWQPKIGDRALVPGGPANAQYVAELREDDVRAIEAGHRGYSPLTVYLIDLNEPADAFDRLEYQQNRGWASLWRGGYARRLQDVLRLAKRIHWKANFEFRANRPEEE